MRVHSPYIDLASYLIWDAGIIAEVGEAAINNDLARSRKLKARILRVSLFATERDEVIYAEDIGIQGGAGDAVFPYEEHIRIGAAPNG